MYKEIDSIRIEVFPNTSDRSDAIRRRLPGALIAALLLFLPLADCSRHPAVSQIGHDSYELERGVIVWIHEKTIEVRANGAVVAKNDQIIRRIDEGKTCMSDGFRKIVGHGRQFTIEQQTCSNQEFITEYLTFKYSAITHDVGLLEFKALFLDRSNPTAEMRQFVYHPQDFGYLKFDNIKIDALYPYLSK